MSVGYCTLQLRLTRVNSLSSPRRNRRPQWSNCVGYNLTMLDVGGSGLTGDELSPEIYVSLFGDPSHAVVRHESHSPNELQRVHALGTRSSTPDSG